jgi:hypothetical protein
MSSSSESCGADIHGSDISMDIYRGSEKTHPIYHDENSFLQYSPNTSSEVAFWMGHTCKVI